MGDKFRTFDGKGIDRRWKVTGIDGKELSCDLMEEFEFINEAGVDITLAFSPLKGGRSDDVIAKGTQLGVNRFIPVIFNRTVARIYADKAEARIGRWDEICRQNSGFSFRSIVPMVDPICLFDNVLELSGFDVKYLFYEDLPPGEGSIVVGDGAKVLMIIGPEGGLEKAEVELAREAGVKLASLGRYILKADTAMIKAVSIFIG